MLRFSSPIPLSLYIHLPWCVQKCPYCDFNSHALRRNLPEELYVNALIAELDSQLPQIWGRRLVSIFFGGGTPSLFSPAAIEKILQAVHARLNFGAIEITLEANPGTVDESRFKGFRKAGVNRLSIGIQSFQVDKLKTLGRIHDSEQALRAVDAAMNAGFSNFNLDLMHGLPQQSVAEALIDLQTAMQFNPPHLSWYQLTIEPNTLFHHRPPQLPIDDVLWEIQEAGLSELSTNNYKQYETSAYARDNLSCVHNKNYWEFGDYLGIGAGAHSKITDVEKNRVTRSITLKHPKEYLRIENNSRRTLTVVNEKELVFEFMLNALRLINGVPMTLFTERTGLPIEVLKNSLQLAQDKKLLESDENYLQPTELGCRFLNDLMAIFLDQSSRRGLTTPSSHTTVRAMSHTAV